MKLLSIEDLEEIDYIDEALRQRLIDLRFTLSDKHFTDYYRLYPNMDLDELHRRANWTASQNIRTFLDVLKYLV